jgi:hypothetical protein
MFCAVSNAGVMRTAYDAAVRRRGRRFIIGWELKSDPPQELANIVVITSLPRTGSLAKANCKRVEPLPAGGVNAMQLHRPYALIDRALDWGIGFTSLVMTAKNDALPTIEYLARLKRHIRLVTQLFEPNGLDGYMVYAGEDFEWAYLHWVDKETSVRAFATPAGKTGPADSASIQRPRSVFIQIFPEDLKK